ncbi:MAG: sugar phosphate isomerase/epimerase family protein [Smithellaceae bacterium]|nr:sugar phosphate isomerase/epimerase family protein [Smithellaceae bacterium]
MNKREIMDKGKDKPQVHVPFGLLKDDHLSAVISEGLNPEIGFNQTTLDETKWEDYIEVAHRLREAGRRITFHAPFLDLRPGALDPKIRQVTMDRLSQIFDLVPLFQPERVVCHPSFDAKYYTGAEQRWLENSLDTWRHFARLAEEMSTTISLENVYEKDPHQLFLLLSALNSPRVCFCLDTGHFNVFSRTPLEQWLNRLGGYLGQLHLHDNDGSLDQHLPIGEGTFPFRKLMTALADREGAPVITTLEAHTRERLQRALKNYNELFPGREVT